MKITFERGINERSDQGIDPKECSDGRNFELGMNINSFQPRASFDYYATAPITTSSTMGFMQLVKRDLTETTLVSVGASVYQVSGASPVFSSVGSITSGSRLRDTYWSLGDYLVITDLEKLTVVKKWDGTTFSTLTTGLGTSLYARYGIVHNGRVWLFNVKTTTDTPHLMVASAFENPESYDTSARAPFATSTATGNEAFYMLSPDLRKIVGATVFMDDLIIVTDRGSLFKLVGVDANDYQWLPFYLGSGSLGYESIINVGNDILYMKPSGAIELFTSTQQYGDVRSDDISRWIPTTIAGLDNESTNPVGSIACYDQINQKVYWFVRTTGGRGKVLVLFKDIMGSELSPWSIYETAHASDFITSAAKFMYQPGTKNYFVFFGDSTGNIFKMNGTGLGDGDTLSSIRTYRTSRLLEGNGVSNIAIGSIQYRRQYEVTAGLSITWGEDYGIDSAAVVLKGNSGTDGAYFGGANYFGGAVYFNQGVQFGDIPSKRSFSHTGMGTTFTSTISIDTVNPFQVDYLELMID